MSGENYTAMDEAGKAIDDFVNRNVSCKTCIFLNYELFGLYCFHPDNNFEVGTDSTCCEAHEFRDENKNTELKKLQEKWLCFF
jgi:hypothetical protein